MLYLMIILKYMLGLLFFLTAIDKIINWSKHLTTIKMYSLIPSILNKPALIFFLLIESFISVNFLLFTNNRIAALSLIILVFIYSTAVTLNLARKNTDFSCGCGSVLESEKLHWGLVLRNLIIILSGVIIFYGTISEQLPFTAKFSLIFICGSTLLFFSIGKILLLLNKKRDQIMKTVKIFEEESA
ncbi:MauE/DoxX family redox-associated membrane protein [Bacillus sp. P14.5]|uniref:MauE/DoxX family redox-associated membrane protein n=1 Tax=Bacillus sp. P14.5 TaxID=1983400 RepID=UPI000DEAD1BF|nr:MauE/DoxX family redox-associated membrane protein [Bacillus sp. P14.5]